MMKKTLALLLAALMIFSSLVFTTAAEEAVAQEEAASSTAGTIIPVYDFEDLSLIDKPSSAMYELDAVNPYNGNSSLGKSFEGLKKGVAVVGFCWMDNANPFDITGMKAICFAVYLENAAGVRNAAFECELRTPEFRMDGNAEIEAGCRINLQDCVVSGELKDGWNLIEIPLSKFTNPYNIDYTRISYFRIFSANAGYDANTGKCSSPQNILGTEGVTTTVKFDTLYFTDVLSENNDDVYDFYLDDITGAGRAWANANYTGLDKNGAAAATSTNAYRVPAVDLTDYDTVTFDIFIEDLSLAKINVFYGISSGNQWDIEESRVTQRLWKYADGTNAENSTLKPGWNTIEVPLSAFGYTAFQTAPGVVNQTTPNPNFPKGAFGSCDFFNVDYTRIYIQPMEFDSKTEGAKMLAISSLRAVKRNTDTAVMVYDKEITVVDKTDGTGNFTATPASISSNGTNFGTTGFGNMVALEFQFYVDVPDVIDAETGEVDVEETNRLFTLATTGGHFNFEITSSGSCDRAESSTAGSLNTTLGTTLQRGWNTIRIYPTITAREDGIDWTKYTVQTKDGVTTGVAYHHTFNPAHFNYVRLFGGGLSADIKNLTIKMKDFKVLRDFDEPSESDKGGVLVNFEAGTFTNASRLVQVTAQNGDVVNYGKRVLSVAAGAVISQPGANHVEDAVFVTPVNISGTDRIAMDIYIENYEQIKGCNFVMALSSRSKCDVADIGRTATLPAIFNGYVTSSDDGNLKEGWNHVDIPLYQWFTTTRQYYASEKVNVSGTWNSVADNGPFDLAKWNFFRTYLHGGGTTAATITADRKTVIAFDNMHFYSSNPTHYEHTAITTNWVNVYLNAGTAAAQRRTITNDVFDIRDMDTLEFDVRVGDYDNNKNFKFALEIGSGHHYDIQECERTVTLEEMGVTAGSTWFHVSLPLSSFVHTGTSATYKDIYGGDFRPYTVNYIGGYNATTITEAFQFHVKNVRFTNSNTNAFATKISGVRPTLNEGIDMTVSAVAPTSSYTAVGMVYKLNGEGITTMTRLPATVTTSTTGKMGYYAFDYEGIPAHRMGDTLTMELWGVNDDHKLTLIESKDYSVKQYCTNMLTAYPTDTKLCTLISDLLVYGAAAQDYLTGGYGTPVTAGLALTPTTTEFTDKLLAGMKVANVISNKPAEAGDFSWVTATLVLDGTVHIRYGFTAESTEGLTVKVGDTTFTEFGEATTANGIEYRYVDIPVTALNFDQAYTASFGYADAESGEPVYSDYTLTYSVNHYLATKYDATMTKTAALLEALYNYGVSAKAYANK